ncbi:MAG: 2-amino-4-hydroxy-6-hydroxymethyldihydropteridine diphosphokinase [Sneathiellales bacterium]|nr:2-amino-4-hydroxy-6-hydroxymethyldihydropteridine diphosphokinase [Sneathiellales bacterium]
MILIGMGANLHHPQFGEPLNSLKAAVEEIRNRNVMIVSQSSYYRSAPVPISDQPWFVNAVLTVETDLNVSGILSLLHDVEFVFGRVRKEKWEARVLDLDLLAYHDDVTANQDQKEGSVVPHPHMHERAFVLAPLAEIQPDWSHPVLNKSAASLLEGLAGDQVFEIIPVET